MVADKDDRHIKLFSRENGADATSDGQDDYLRGVEKVAGAEAETVDDTPLGNRIKALREQKGVELADMVQRTGLKEAEILAIEAGKTSPPLGVLIKLGKALDAELGTLFATGRAVPYVIVRQTDRTQMHRRPADRDTSYGYSYEHLAQAKCNRTMEPFVVTLKPDTELKPPSSHDGEEFIFVLSGKMEALVGDATEILEPGDSIYYDSSVPHLVRAHGGQPAQILAVLTSGSK